MNQDGEITLAAMRQGLRESLGMELARKDARTLFDRFDADGGGTIRVDELLGAIARARAGSGIKDGYSDDPKRHGTGRTGEGGGRAAL